MVLHNKLFAKKTEKKKKLKYMLVQSFFS